jgi:hypothetical protein
MFEYWLRSEDNKADSKETGGRKIPKSDICFIRRFFNLTVSSSDSWLMTVRLAKYALGKMWTEAAEANFEVLHRQQA